MSHVGDERIKGRNLDPAITEDVARTSVATVLYVMLGATCTCVGRERGNVLSFRCNAGSGQQMAPYRLLVVTGGRKEVQLEALTAFAVTATLLCLFSLQCTGSSQ